ncbi:MAG: helix-turn-helix domain-containing protein [Candidatus Methanoplasma sp.]|jgi:transcriptional regulator with XRE-family HTH domain|nr:helix-turn-helix domain-containing protein [Candidatus Methanoplasma sp.]
MDYCENTYSLSDREIVEDIGRKLLDIRLKNNTTRKELQFVTGVHEKTIGDAEKGKNVTLINLVSILRGLGALDLLEPLIEEEIVSPAMLFKNRGKVRKRATGSRKTKIDL